MRSFGALRYKPHSPEINIPTFLSALLLTPGDFQEDKVLLGALIWATPRVLIGSPSPLNDLVEVSSRGRYDTTEEWHLLWGTDPGL